MTATRWPWLALGVLLVGQLVALFEVHALRGSVASLEQQLTRVCEARAAEATGTARLAPPLASLEVERVASVVAQRVQQSCVPESLRPAQGQPEARSPEAERDAAEEAVELAGGLVADLQRAPALVHSWHEAGRALAAIPDREQRGRVKRELLAAITRGELQPPADLDYMQALLGAPQP